MTMSMYQASVPVFSQVLTNLSAILTKGAEYCAARKIEPSVVLNWRLAPDMYTLIGQVQILTDQVKGGTARLAGVAVPSYADTEATFDDLQARIAKTQDFIAGFTADQIDGTEDKTVTMKIGPNETSFQGQLYLTKFVVPNVYFHATTAYAILRHCGVDVGKRDFLGKIF